MLFIWEVPLYHTLRAVSRGWLCEHIRTVLVTGVERMYGAKDLRAQGQKPHPSQTEEPPAMLDVNRGYLLIMFM